jgi:hypothetical protein
LQRKGLNEGYGMSIQTCGELAQLWYSGRLEKDWNRPDRDEIQDLFNSLNLDGQFWELT